MLWRIYKQMNNYSPPLLQIWEHHWQCRARGAPGFPTTETSSAWSEITHWSGLSPFGRSVSFLCLLVQCHWEWDLELASQYPCGSGCLGFLGVRLGNLITKVGSLLHLSALWITNTPRQRHGETCGIKTSHNISYNTLIFIQRKHLNKVCLSSEIYNIGSTLALPLGQTVITYTEVFRLQLTTSLFEVLPVAHKIDYLY